MHKVPIYYYYIVNKYDLLIVDLISNGIILLHRDTMLKENCIRSFSQEEITFDELIKKIEQFNNLEYNFYIGSDSQIIKNKVSIVTCLCAHNRMRGGQIFYVKEKVPLERLKSLRARMLYEAYKSLEAALELEEYIFTKITIHLDIGSNPKKSPTHKFKDELQFLIKSQGYDCEIKPYSWASSSVADRLTKT
jgi:predicted RNase H-related nuclease YkuK (DUF458 family)